MEMNGERRIEAPRETVWQGLNDPEVLRHSIPGCESVERTGEDSFQARVAVKLGPMAAKFTGKVQLTNINPPASYTIGGEGNGGIIVPDFHYGRDALIGIGLFLSHFAGFKKGLKSFRGNYPDYFISKNKIELETGMDVGLIFEKIQKKYKNNPINTEDGLKIEFDTDWVHLRTSNTEPIIRIYAESSFETTADHIARKLMQDIKENIQA